MFFQCSFIITSVAQYEMIISGRITFVFTWVNDANNFKNFHIYVTTISHTWHSRNSFCLEMINAQIF